MDGGSLLSSRCSSIAVGVGDGTEGCCEKRQLSLGSMFKNKKAGESYDIGNAGTGKNGKRSE